MYLSEIGKIVFEEWLNTPRVRPNVFLDDFIIMPNHIHGIVGIKEFGDFVETHSNINDFGHPHGRDTVYRVSTDRKFGGLKPKSLSSIINTFKGAASRQCHKDNFDFQWQPNYYEHIIKDEADLSRIKEYIAQNPINWASDRNNPLNIKIKR